MIIKDSLTEQQTIGRYYEYQSSIYDATRWSFLLGRDEIIKTLSFAHPPKHIVEVGCGTGHNLKKLGQCFPNTNITGIDLSKEMLSIARKKVSFYPNIYFFRKAYSLDEIHFEQAPDLILFSYALTMMNPNFSKAIFRAYDDLAPGGKIAVVDFHSSDHSWFKKHMSRHHVRMDGHLDAPLELAFKPIQFNVRKGHLGLWKYFLFVGEKKVEN